VKEPPWLLVPPGSLEGDGRLQLPALEGRHATGPLRLRTGDRVILADGAGAVAEGRLVAASKGRVEAEIVTLKIAPPPAGSGVTLAIGVIDNRAMDWVVQKSVEVGVRTLVPLFTERTQAGAREVDRRIDHWRRIALQALKQCRRPWGMEISGGLTLSEVLERTPPERGVVADPGGDSVTCLSEAAGWLLAVGPEGGFSPTEDRLFADHGWRRLYLGPHILRAETAAVVGPAFLMTRLKSRR
jgi:16S rRNA (uracil1498-N3)-methyltransferase